MLAGVELLEEVVALGLELGVASAERVVLELEPESRSHTGVEFAQQPLDVEEQQ